MSNIPDVGTLSDLFEEVESDDNIDEVVLNPEVQSNADVHQIEVVAEDVNFIDSKSTDPEDIISKQQLKIELSQERENVIKLRKDLLEQVEELKIRYNRLHRQHGNDKQELKKLLKANEDNYIKKHTEGLNNSLNLFSDGEENYEGTKKRKNNESSSIEDFNVLPSKDWSKRKLYVKKFISSIEIHSMKSDTQIEEETRELINVMNFNIKADNLFDIHFQLVIKRATESVIQLSIGNDSDQRSLMSAIYRLSSYFKTVFFSNYISNKKIDLAIYSLNSLAEQVNHRVFIFFQVLADLSSFSDNPELDIVLKMNIDSDKEMITKLMKNINSLRFKFMRDGKSYSMILLWDIVILDTIIGECSPDISLSVRRDNDDGHVSSSDGLDESIESISTLFKELVALKGILPALDIVLKKLLRVECLRISA